MFGEHDNGGALLFPNHPPKVVLCVWQGTLGGYELLCTVVALYASIGVAKYSKSECESGYGSNLTLI